MIYAIRDSIYEMRDVRAWRFEDRVLQGHAYHKFSIVERKFVSPLWGFKILVLRSSGTLALGYKHTAPPGRRI